MNIIIVNFFSLENKLGQMYKSRNAQWHGNVHLDITSNESNQILFILSFWIVTSFKQV